MGSEGDRCCGVGVLGRRPRGLRRSAGLLAAPRSGGSATHGGRTRKKSVSRSETFTRGRAERRSSKHARRGSTEARGARASVLGTEARADCWPGAMLYSQGRRSSPAAGIKPPRVERVERACRLGTLEVRQRPRAWNLHRIPPCIVPALRERRPATTAAHAQKISLAKRGLYARKRGSAEARKRGSAEARKRGSAEARKRGSEEARRAEHRACGTRERSAQGLGLQGAEHGARGPGARLRTCGAKPPQHARRAGCGARPARRLRARERERRARERERGAREPGAREREARGARARGRGCWAGPCWFSGGRRVPRGGSRWWRNGPGSVRCGPWWGRGRGVGRRCPARWWRRRTGGGRRRSGPPPVG